MKIIRVSWSGEDTEVSISEAISGGLTDQEGRGIAETANDTAMAVAAAIGLLIEQLHEKCILSDAQVRAHLSHCYKMVK